MAISYNNLKAVGELEDDDSDNEEDDEESREDEETDTEDEEYENFAFLEEDRVQFKTDWQFQKAGYYLTVNHQWPCS